MSYPTLQFLKLGGSLITDKTRPHTARMEVIYRLGREIAAAIQQQPDLRLLVGHGSGSFGHVAAHRYSTRQGVRTESEWHGFAEVWREAASLNHLVVDALVDVGLPAIAFPPSASVLAEGGKVLSWDIAPLREALKAGLLPVVHGDVVFDTQLGGTILSTEDLFLHLASEFAPKQVLLAGLEAGVWADYPQRTRLLSQISPGTLGDAIPNLGESSATDVTGGMASKVSLCMELIQKNPSLQVRIFSGEVDGLVERALAGEAVGTTIRG